MKAPTQGEFDRYVQSAEGKAWIASPEFERRCIELFDRLDAGEQITGDAAADLVGLPVGVLEHVWESLPPSSARGARRRR